MYKHLHLTAWIMLFAFITLPLVSLAHYGDGSFHAIHCTTCGEAAHMMPGCEDDNDPEPVYQHASDCPCNECVAKRENDSLGLDDDDSIWNRYIKPTITTYIPEPVVNFIEDNLEHIGKAGEAATQMGGPPNPMNAW